MFSTIRDVWNYLFGTSYPQQHQLDSLRQSANVENVRETRLIKSEIGANLELPRVIELVRHPTLGGMWEAEERAFTRRSLIVGSREWHITHPEARAIMSPRPLRRPLRFLKSYANATHEDF